MKRLLLTLPLVLAAAIGAGCNKPSDANCRKAVDNIRRITGTASSEFGADREEAVRACKGNASRESVQCMLNAKNVTDLQACEGEKGKKFFQQEEAAQKKKREEWLEKHPNQKTQGGPGEPTAEPSEGSSDGH